MEMAAGFVASAAANTAGNLATEYASPYLSYFFHFGKIVKDFKNRRQELELKKDRVKNDVDEAIRQTEVIAKDVEYWLTRADKELGESRSLEDEIERNKCFKWCPNWGWRYCLSKKVAKKTINISKLLETGNFPQVGHRAPLQGIELLLSKDFMHSESSQSAFNEIMKALNSDDVNMIGLYGMPGVGKTTLANEVMKQAAQQKLFDPVVIVTMSQTPNINNIQDKIRERLGLTFKANTVQGKAEELWQRLKGEKKILIIVDDIWKYFPLQTIGIPCGDGHRGCKVLLTTRLRQVCTQMDCQKEIQLDILSENEAWALFRDNAGLTDVPSSLNDVAKEIALECQGLPLAIVIIAKALKRQNADEWMAVRNRLKDSRHLDNQDVSESIYPLLEPSYDYLRNDNIKSCFLLCSLFPEDDDIDIELLTICGIGTGLFSDSNIDSFEDVRREIRSALRKLQDCGLLLEIHPVAFILEATPRGFASIVSFNVEERVRMHDVLRDFAHWLKSTGENKFMVKDGLREWPTAENFGCYTAIALWNCSKITNFPDKVEFPKLETLFLVGEDSLKVPSTIFEEMKALQVLLLRNVVVSLEGLQSLTKLQTLCFVRCKLENMSSSLRNMRKLKILAFFDTNIHEPPEELVELPRLKSFYISHRGKQRINFPPNLLSRLTSLQELHVTSDNNVNLLELNSLSSLTALSLKVFADQHFKENFMFPKLQKYAIGVNDYPGYLKGTFRTLKIKDLSSSLSAFKDLFCNVEDLTLENIIEAKNIVPNIAKEGVNELTSLELKFCKDMEFFIDIKGEQGLTFLEALRKLKCVRVVRCERLQAVFRMDGLFERVESQITLLSNLTILDLTTLPELESIWKLEPSHHAIVSLQSLKVVVVYFCNKLKSIFSHCRAQSLLHLQQLKIIGCNVLEQVFGFTQEEVMFDLEETLSNLTCLELSSLPKLSCIWKGLTRGGNLRSLKFMIIQYCDKLAYLFLTPLAQTLVHLEEINISNCDSLEQLIGEAGDENEICVSNVKTRNPLCLPKLKTLKISHCRSLKYLFPNTLTQELPCLESVNIEDCPQLIQFYCSAKERDGNDMLLKLPSLRKLLVHHCPQWTFFVQVQLIEETLSNLTWLELRSLPKLSYLWKGLTHGVKLRSLKTMTIENCDKLAYLFLSPLVQTLVHLEEINISNCDSLEQLIGEAGDENEYVFQTLRLAILCAYRNWKLSIYPIAEA